jgi:hypothetical protein
VASDKHATEKGKREAARHVIQREVHPCRSRYGDIGRASFEAHRRDLDKIWRAFHLRLHT